MAPATPHDLPNPELFVAADLSTAEGAETVVSDARDRLGGVGILVNNVGGSSVPGGGLTADARRVLGDTSVPLMYGHGNVIMGTL